MENYRTALAETKIHRTTGYKSPNCFQCNFWMLDSGAKWRYFLVEIDSTFCKVHQHAAGARKILGNQNIEVSRGGKTTKIHALVNEHFQLVGISLSKVTLEGKKFWRTRVIAPKRYEILFRKKKLKFVLPTSPMPSSFTILLKNFINRETLLNDFFNV